MAQFVFNRGSAPRSPLGGAHDVPPAPDFLVGCSVVLHLLVCWGGDRLLPCWSFSAWNWMDRPDPMIGDIGERFHDHD